MKKNYHVFRTVLLCVFSVLLINCKKDSSDSPTETIWNYSTFTDSRDGKTYKSIKIGDQEWMAENLAYETSSGSWTYWNDAGYGQKYGRLYTWAAANQAAPVGWHLPSDAEWKQLEIFIGMSKGDADLTDFRGTDESVKLKSKSDWAFDGNGTDNFGLTFMAGGFRSNSGIFLGRESYAYFWSSTENDNASSWYRLLAYYNPKVNRYYSFKEEAYSVRCVKN